MLAEITNLNAGKMGILVNEKEFVLHFYSGGFSRYASFGIQFGDYWFYIHNLSTLNYFLDALRENREDILILCKLISQYTSSIRRRRFNDILRKIYKDDKNQLISMILKGVFFHLVCSDPLYSLREFEGKIKPLLPKAKELFTDEKSQKWLKRILDIKTYIVAQEL